MAGPQIEPVIGRVLRNQVQLFHAVGDELPCFPDDVRLAATAMRAAHPRDDAKTARMIAPLGNLHIREMIRRQSKPRRLKCRDVIGPRVNIDQRLTRYLGGNFCLVAVQFFLRLAKPRAAIVNRLPDDIADLFDLVDAHEGVHLRHQLGQLLPITLRQTARDDQRLAGVRVLPKLHRLEDRIDALLLRGIDERTGVDDQRIGVGIVVGDLEALLHQRAHHHLGIDEIFGAPQRDHPHFQRPLFFCVTIHAANKLRSTHTQLNPAPGSLPKSFTFSLSPQSLSRWERGLHWSRQHLGLQFSAPL